MILRRPPLSMLAVAVLLVGGLGLAVLAVHSVVRTAATEIAPQVPPPSSTRVRIGPEAGALAPAFEAPSYAQGETVRLDAFRGHPIVLNFWASWCPPCRAETEELEAAYLRFKDRGVVILGIDSETDTWGESRAFLHQHGVTYPVARDVRGAVARAYRIAALPTTYFIGADGRVQGPAVTGGFTGEDGARDLAAGIEKMLR